MMKLIASVLLLAAYNLVAPVYAQQSRSELVVDDALVATIGSVEFKECRIEAQTRERVVQCGYLPVPENPANIGSKPIQLFIVRIPAKRHAKVKPDPMLFIAGGPGQAASESFLFIDQSFTDLSRTRDFYLIDQRGTGYSNKLTCPESEKLHSQLYTNLQTEDIKEFAQQCLAELPGEPQEYTTDNTVKDFEAARQALNIERWNLLGVSYGTRVATHYMRRFPQSIRSVVLDSVIPPEHPVGTGVSYYSQVALDNMIERCETESRCNESLPNLKEEINRLFARLSDNSIHVKYEDFSKGKLSAFDLTEEHLNLIVRMNLYNPYSTAVLPPMLFEAARNHYYSPLARMSQKITEHFNDSLAIGLHFSVVCTEDQPYYESVENLFTRSQSTYLGSAPVDIINSVCDIWPTEAAKTDEKTQLKSNIPTLLFSGEYDPITPPEYGDATLAHLTNARHFVLSGQAHHVTTVGCAPYLINQFVDALAPRELNSHCLERVSAPPLMINFNGSAP